MMPRLESDDSKIPLEYREIFAHLCGEVVQTKERLREYRELFAFSEKRVALLNESGAFFFSTVDQLFIDNLILSLSRLFDPAQTFGKANLTFSRLIEMLETSNPMLADKLKASLEKAKEASAPLQKFHRHKRIAHNDYSTAVADESVLPTVSLQGIEQAILDVERLLSEFHSAYAGFGTEFNLFDHGDGAVALLDRLFKAHAYDVLCKRGIIPTDFHGHLAKEEGFF